MRPSRRWRRGAARPTAAAVLWMTGVALAHTPLAARQKAPPGPYTPPIAGTWEPVASIGQPLRWKPFLRLAYGLDVTGGEAAGPSVAAGAFRSFFNPVYGALGLGAQAYAGQTGEAFDGGLQVSLESHATFLHAGADWSLRTGRVDALFGLSFPLRRGGWPAAGSHLRIDWIPGRAQSVVLGFTLPLKQPLEGRTRSRAVDVELPRPPKVARPRGPARGTPAAAVLSDLLESMEWLAGLHGFFWLTNFSSLGRDEAVAETRGALTHLKGQLTARDSLLPGRHTYEREVEVYHTSLDRAFGLALGASAAEAEPLGRPLADRARRVTLEEVVLPYNRAIGRYKQPDLLDGLAARGRARFIAWLELEDRLQEAPGDHGRAEVLGVLDAWLGGFEGLRRRMSDLKRDARMHWLPLALVLRPDEHETQAEVDALVELALGRTFRGGNDVEVIAAARFQAELRRTILEAEAYHVLWIHDYRGRNALGDPDRVGFQVTTEGYLQGLLGSVRAYDDTGRLPVYLLMVDQHFYEQNDGRLWLELLERPLAHRVRLPHPGRDMERTIERMQDSLRAAVARSRRLQAEAEALGSDWIERVVKVHVNVTNPSDFSFRSRRLLRRGPPLGADNMMRDHRKIVIRDVTEGDPRAGEVILAGVGVGEHYASPTWDDTGLILRGPAALEAKAMAREVLERHRLTGDRLPAPLRPAPYAEDYAERVRERERAGATARVLQVHNRTGWGAKDASFVQMLLYDLVPAGTVIYVPDSLWSSYEWMAQLLSAALRGCRVYVVAPALANAPSPGFLPMSITEELITRVVLVNEAFGDLIGEAGGELRIGLYSRTSSLNDLPGVLTDVDTTFASNPFLQEIFPFSADARAVIDRYRNLPSPTQQDEPAIADVVARLPKMHRKTQLLASADVLRKLAAAPEMAGALDDAFRATLTGEPGRGPGEPGAGAYARLGAASRRIEEDSGREGGLLYFLTGSVNKNVRSMALDGEVLAVVAGPWALEAYVDFVLLSGGASWVRTVEDVDALLPPFSSLKRWIGRWLHRVT